jgi:16S rRNA (guanine966-N2)-methyltransferase
MRVTGGQYAGRPLKVPSGLDVRPTPDRVRQAIFNSLGDRITDAAVLELFAGSGALTFESLSRGAKHGVCVEKSRHHGSFILSNSHSLGLGRAEVDVRVQDVFTALPQLANLGTSFDIILADPPYGEKNVGKRSSSLAQKLLDDAALPRLIKKDGLLVLGHTKRDTLTIPVTFREVKEMKHGDTMFRFLAIADEKKPDDPQNEPSETIV